jgi:uncharacterized protein YjbI with pentapeptide repeats
VLSASDDRPELTEASLVKASPLGAQMQRANLAGADFTEADLASTLLPGAAALAETRNLDKARNLNLARRSR